MTDLVEQWRIEAAKWLDLQDAADILRETKNDVFAEIVEKSAGSSHAEKERRARCSDEWRGYRNKMIEAEAKARRAKFRVRYRSMQFDSWRTQNANARVERAAG